MPPKSKAQKRLERVSALLESNVDAYIEALDNIRYAEGYRVEAADWAVIYLALKGDSDVKP